MTDLAADLGMEARETAAPDAVDADALAEALERVSHTGERPDGLPDQFWNPEASQVRWESVVKVIKDQQRAIRGAGAAAPEEYAVELSEEAQALLLGDGDEDPLLGMALHWAKETGQSQENFTKLLQGFDRAMGEIMARRPTAEQEMDVLRTTLREQYGNAERADAAVVGLSNFINATLPEEDALRSSAVEYAKTGEGFAVLDAFRAAMRDRVLPTRTGQYEHVSPLAEYQALARREAEGALSPADMQRKGELRAGLDAREHAGADLTRELALSVL